MSAPEELAATNEKTALRTEGRTLEYLVAEEGLEPPTRGL